MADAKQCDRCGEFYVKNRVTDLRTKTITSGIGFFNVHNKYIIGTGFDLCDNCLNELNKWLNNPNAMVIIPENIESRGE